MGRQRSDATHHHLNPRSRKKYLMEIFGIKNEDERMKKRISTTKPVAQIIHTCWHLLFYNYLAWEAIEQIKLWATNDLAGFKIFFDIKIKMAWYIVFGNASPKEAIEKIKKDWWPEYPSVEEAKNRGLLKP